MKLVSSKWTPDTLYDHFTAVLSARDDALHAALASLIERLKVMNEFRAAINDTQAKYITRSEVYALLGAFAALCSGIAIIASLVGHFTSAPAHP
jgi:hypothetical protein